MSKWEIVVDRVIKFLKETLPGLLAAFAFGKSMGDKKLSKTQAKLDEAELKLEYKNNEDAIDKKYSNMSDGDIVSSAIKGPGSKQNH